MAQFSITRTFYNDTNAFVSHPQVSRRGVSTDAKPPFTPAPQLTLPPHNTTMSPHLRPYPTKKPPCSTLHLYQPCHSPSSPPMHSTINSYTSLAQWRGLVPNFSETKDKKGTRPRRCFALRMPENLRWTIDLNLNMDLRSFFEALWSILVLQKHQQHPTSQD